MAQEDRFSAFYPTIIYPEHEQAAHLREMSGHLQTIVRNLSQTRQSQSQTQIVRSQPQTLIVQQDPDAAYQAAMLANDLRERLGEGMIGLRESLSDLSSQIEWGFESLNESITQQTSVLLTIAKQQTRRAELDASEHLSNARGMVNQLRDSIQSGRLNASHNERLFEAADKRFKLAIEESPSSGLMYAILLGRAELHILVEKNDEALAILEENLIYAPKDKTFDSCSYLYRLIGRIVFARGDTFEVVHEAIYYLAQAVKHSPDYAIAWYDLAQYSAQLSGDSDTDPALRHLRKAIELKPNFLVLASIEPNFDPIRKDVDAIQQEIRTKQEEAFRTETEKMRQDCLSRFDSRVSAINEIVRLSRNLWQIKKLADEIIPWVRSQAMPSSPYTTQDWNTGELVARGASDLEKLSLLRTRTLAADSRDDVVTCRSEAGCMGFQLSREIDILQKQWAFWRHLVSDAEMSIHTETQFNAVNHTTRIAELEKKLEIHERQRPQPLSRKAQKYSDLEEFQVRNLPYTYDSEKIKHELYNHLSWRKEQQKILNEIEWVKTVLERIHLRVVTINKFLEEFQQLSRA